MASSFGNVINLKAFRHFRHSELVSESSGSWLYKLLGYWDPETSSGQHDGSPFKMFGTQIFLG